MDANVGQPRLSNRTHSPHQLDREVVKKIKLGLGIDNNQPVWLSHLRGRTEKVGAPRNVSKGLVDGNPFDERSEIIEHIDGSIAQPLVILEMPADKDQLWTQLTGPPSRHTATDSK